MGTVVREKEHYMLVRKGRVQRIMGTLPDGRTGKVWPLAQNVKDAKRLMNLFKCKEGTSPARIGSAKGETLEGHIALAIDDGCIAAFCVLGWNDDGSPQWGYIDFQ